MSSSNGTSPLKPPAPPPAVVKVSCIKCRGACCEEFVLPAQQIRTSDDASRWFALHATRREAGLFFECACTKLTEMGKCSIYETRPRLCHDFVAGGPACLEVLRRRRTLEQQAAILGKD